MSHVTAGAILSDPIGTFSALTEIAWRLPLRLATTSVNNLLPNQRPKTSLQVAAASSIFAPLLAHNWQLLLARPRRFIESGTGLLFPSDVGSETLDKDRKHGFHGYLYISHHSKKFGTQSIEGADAVWIHAHGGGFYAGEARQYHHTYMRWVDKAWAQFGLDLRILALEYPLSGSNPYPGCINSILAAYKYLLHSNVTPQAILLAGDSAGGNGALSACYEIIEKSLPSPAGVIMMSPWLDLSRSTSGNSPNQVTDWLTTFDSEECRVGAIEQYKGDDIDSSYDPRVSPLWRTPDPRLPKQLLSAGTAEVLYSDATGWAEKVVASLGTGAIECHFAPNQVHTFAIGGWLADPDQLEVSDHRLMSFVSEQVHLRDV